MLKCEVQNQVERESIQSKIVEPACAELLSNAGEKFCENPLYRLHSENYKNKLPKKIVTRKG